MIEADDEDEDAADDNDEKIYWTRANGLIHLWYLLIMSQLWGIYGFCRGFHWLLLFQLSVNLVSEFKCCSASQGVVRQGILDVADEGCACILFFILSVGVPRYHQTTFLRDQPDGKGFMGGISFHSIWWGYISFEILPHLAAHEDWVEWAL